MKNKIWNYYYDVRHHLYMSWGSNGDIGMKEAFIVKIEIIKETPKKIKLRFTKLSTFNEPMNIKIDEKLYDKEKVTIDNISTFDQLLEKIENYKIAVKDSDKIADYKKKAILEEFDKLTEEELRKHFN